MLFNHHRALEAKSKAIVIVEGFFDCLKVWQAGFLCTVALMGSALSEHQEKLLVENFDRVAVMLDGDEGGRSATSQITARLIRKQFVRVVDLPDGTQPDKLSSGEIQKLLAFLGKGGLLNE